MNPACSISAALSSGNASRPALRIASDRSGRADSPGQGDAAEREEGAKAVGKRIMLVEDEAIIAMDIAQRLESYGYQVVAMAASGQQALARATATRPDLVVMDIMIKGPADGIDTAVELRKVLRVPVIFLSANSDESTVARARAAEAYGYLVKPFRPEELRACIEVALVKWAMEEQLRLSKQWFAKTLQCISDGVIATDGSGQVKLLNRVAERLTGWCQEEAHGRSIDEVVRTIDERDGRPVGNPLAGTLQGRRSAPGLQTALLLGRDGRHVAIEEGSAPIVDDERRVMGAVMVLRDVSQRREVERALRESEERFHSAFDHASIGMALVAMDGAILQTNTSMARMFGYSEAEMLGMRLGELGHPDDMQDEMSVLHVLLADELPSVQLEKRYVHRGGLSMWVLLNISLVRSPDGKPLYCIFQAQDLTARRAAEARLVQLAHHDLLTGLVNRAYFIEAAGQMIASARRRGERLGLLFIDLDGFKTINDGHGHKAGDTVLTTTAQRMRDALRDSDLIGRWGGDEFVVIVEMAGSREQLAPVASKLIDDLGQPILVGVESATISASIGIAIYPHDGQTLAALVANADSAMYQAKEAGKNQYCFVAEDSAAAIARQSRRENQLRHAIERNEFVLHYQPLVSQGRIAGVEALVRWQHPDEGLLPPGEFIPIAERSGLILPLGEWVLRTACTQALAWRRHYGIDLKVAVNVSVRQLRQPNFPQLVADILDATGMPPQGLELEVTESWIMNSVQRSAHVLSALSGMGIEITVDDFGTGYSSLAYLKRLPLNRLKIDRSFLVDLPGDAQGEAIVRAIVSLAGELSLDVVAEGVENDPQRDFILGLGDISLQGYGVHRPMAAAAIDRLLRTDGTLPPVA